MMPVKGRPDLEKMVCPINDLIQAAGGRRQPGTASSTPKKKGNVAKKSKPTKTDRKKGAGRKRKVPLSDDDESDLSSLESEVDVDGV